MAGRVSGRTPAREYEPSGERFVIRTSVKFPLHGGLHPQPDEGLAYDFVWYIGTLGYLFRSHGQTTNETRAHPTPRLRSILGVGSRLSNCHTSLP